MSKKKSLLLSHNPEETLAFAKELAHRLTPGTTILLYGDLGAGKTTFVRGLAEGLGCEGTVQSPTFTYLNIYEGERPLYHFDLYRLKGKKDFYELGFDEYLGEEICAIEWPERLEGMEIAHALSIEFSHIEEGKREISWES